MKPKFGIFSWILGIAMVTTSLGLATLGFAASESGWRFSDKESGEHGERGESGNGLMRSTTSQMMNSAGYQAYAEECASCHMAYPAGFLPKRSWEEIMTNLDNHFGDNAELDPPTQAAVLSFLMDNAWESGSNRRSRKFSRSVDMAMTPMRITELPYFKRKHDEVSPRYVVDNPEVGSFSQCQACHGKDAEKGIFDEDTVDIPGYGRWD